MGIIIGKTIRYTMTQVFDSTKVGKQRRKSARLQEIEEKRVSTILKQPSAIGVFGRLPTEIIYTIFSYLTVKDFSLLTISSKMLRDTVEVFRRSRRGFKHFCPTCLLDKTTEDGENARHKSFHTLGIYLKRSTCLYATKDRLRMIEDFIKDFECDVAGCKCLHKCMALTYYGIVLHAVIAGWNDEECVKVFDVIGNKSSVTKYLNIALNCPAGTRKNLELVIRLFYRRIFLDNCSTDPEKGFWLTRILKPLPIFHQAKLLMIFYGPVINDEIQWNGMYENVAANITEAKSYFSELAVVILILFRDKPHFSNDDIVSILAELTEMPEGWLPENTATLLFLLGDSVATLYLGNKVLKREITEVSLLLTSFALVSKRFGEKISRVFDLAMRVCNVREKISDKIQFWNSICDSFKNSIVNLFDLNNFGEDEPEHTLFQIFESYTEIFKCSLKLWAMDKHK